MKERRRLMPGESAFAWLALAFGLFLFYESYKIAGFSSISSAGGTPLAASGLMVLCALTIVLSNRRALPVDAATWREELRRFHVEILPLQPLIVYVLIILAYMLLLEPLGFNLTSLLFLFVSFWYLHRKGLWIATWVSVVSVVAIYVTFQLVFQVTLPDGDWLEPFYRMIGR